MAICDVLLTNEVSRINSNTAMFCYFCVEPYTVREARIHVRHVRDLLKSLDPSDAYNGMDCQSLSFLTTILNDGK